MVIRLQGPHSPGLDFFQSPPGCAETSEGQSSQAGGRQQEEGWDRKRDAPVLHLGLTLLQIFGAWNIMGSSASENSGIM